MSRQVARKWVQLPAARAVAWAVGSGWAVGSSNRALPNRRCVSRVTGVRIFPFSSQDLGEGRRKDLKIPLSSSCGCVTSASAATAAGPGACRRSASPWRPRRPRRPSCRAQLDPSGYPCPRCRQGQRRVTARPPPTAMTRGARPARRSARRRSPGAADRPPRSLGLRAPETLEIDRSWHPSADQWLFGASRMPDFRPHRRCEPLTVTPHWSGASRLHSRDTIP